jgi:hypothetical protein
MQPKAIDQLARSDSPEPAYRITTGCTLVMSTPRKA